MKSDVGTHVPLEEFQRHFIHTHMKDRAIGILEELETQAKRSGRPLDEFLAEWFTSNYPQGAFRDDQWYVEKVPLDTCFIAHPDFRHHPIPKGARYIDFLPRVRGSIESGRFPCSDEISSPWLKEMPEPLAQEREPNKYFILDGQARVIRHWYHNVLRIRLYLYRGEKDV